MSNKFIKLYLLNLLSFFSYGATSNPSLDLSLNNKNTITFTKSNNDFNSYDLHSGHGPILPNDCFVPPLNVLTKTKGEVLVAKRCTKEASRDPKANDKTAGDLPLYDVFSEKENSTYPVLLVVSEKEAIVVSNNRAFLDNIVCVCPEIKDELKKYKDLPNEDFITMIEKNFSKGSQFFQMGNISYYMTIDNNGNPVAKCYQHEELSFSPGTVKVYSSNAINPTQTTLCCKKAWPIYLLGYALGYCNGFDKPTADFASRVWCTAFLNGISTEEAIKLVSEERISAESNFRRAFGA
jgi:hypothetical protein